MTPEDLMYEAIAVCQEGIQTGQSPFGCAVALDDRLVARRHNTVLLSTDITAHAEINALRLANQQTGQILLSGAVVATTCEPCPMCMAALHWARVEVVYFGASIADAKQAGFNELQLPAQELLRLGASPIRLVGGVLADECRSLFAQWKSDPRRRTY